VAQYKNVHFTLNRLELMKSGKHKYGGLSHTRFRLADDVHAQHGLRNALMLHCKFVNIQREERKEKRWNLILKIGMGGNSIERALLARSAGRVARGLQWHGAALSSRELSD
jgi:hypothetical protein